MDKEKNEIIIFENQDVKLEVNLRRNCLAYTSTNGNII